MADRIIAMRNALRDELTAAGSTKDWTHVTSQIGAPSSPDAMHPTAARAIQPHACDATRPHARPLHVRLYPERLACA